MLIHPHQHVYLSIVSKDLPGWYGVETVATLYQKDQEHFHLVLMVPQIFDPDGSLMDSRLAESSEIPTSRLLWLELSPYRITLTLQGKGEFSYRHFWERGMYGISRYWLYNHLSEQNSQFCLRNFTNRFVFQSNPLPGFLQVEYELWTDKMKLGQYVLSLEIRH